MRFRWMAMCFTVVLVSRQRQERRSINGTTRGQIEAAAAYFNENYTARINVDEYAESLHMSTAWFIRSFKQYVGLSPARYIQSLRIVNAQRLLERTKYSIGEVSEIVGYDNPLYFSRVFKKETDYTFTSYLTRYRMKKAMSLLKDCRVKVYEVAEQVGYSDTAYFSAQFKKLIGISPSEYQDRSR